jgi:hypothetical protein
MGYMGFGKKIKIINSWMLINIKDVYPY